MAPPAKKSPAKKADEATEKRPGETDPSSTANPLPAGAGETAPGAGETAPERKRGAEGGVDAIAIPAKQLRVERAPPDAICRPELPPDDSTMDAWEVLKDYIPWVKHELAKSAVVRGSGAAKPLWQYAPLGMQVAGAKTQSYMAPWDDAVAAATLRATHLHLFGGTIAWLQPSESGPAPVVRLSWRNTPDRLRGPPEGEGG